MDTISLALVHCTSMFIRSSGANRSLSNGPYIQEECAYTQLSLTNSIFIFYFTISLNYLNICIEGAIEARFILASIDWSKICFDIFLHWDLDVFWTTAFFSQSTHNITATIEVHASNIQQGTTEREAGHSL